MKNLTPDRKKAALKKKVKKVGYPIGYIVLAGLIGFATYHVFIA